MNTYKNDFNKPIYLVKNEEIIDQNPTEVIRIEAKPIIDMFDGLEALDYPFAITSIKSFCKVYQLTKDDVHIISHT